MNAPIRNVDASQGSQSASGNANAPAFVHLRVHSAYSLLEGALPIPSLPKLAAAHNMPAIGISDTNNLFGALDFSEKLAGAGVQPIVGVTLATDFEGDGESDWRRRERLAKRETPGKGAGVLRKRASYE